MNTHVQARVVLEILLTSLQCQSSSVVNDCIYQIVPISWSAHFDI